jgi:hypothetical protein
MNFDEAFKYKNDDLDKMARELHNKKNSMYSNVKKSNRSKDKEILQGIEAFENQPGFTFSPHTSDYKGDFVSGNPTPLDSDTYDQYSNSQDISQGDSFSLGGQQNSEHFLSLSDGNCSDSDDVWSEYSYLPKNKKKSLRSNNKHLQKYTENDEQLILEHIKNCSECKNHLLSLLKNDNHFIQKEIDLPKEKDDNNSLFGKINYKEIKEVIILIIIGIIVIFILDIFLRR